MRPRLPPDTVAALVNTWPRQAPARRVRKRKLTSDEIAVLVTDWPSSSAGPGPPAPKGNIVIAKDAFKAPVALKDAVLFSYGRRRPSVNASAQTAQALSDALGVIIVVIDPKGKCAVSRPRGASSSDPGHVLLRKVGNQYVLLQIDGIMQPRLDALPPKFKACIQSAQ
jgi:hypothetical protein